MELAELEILPDPPSNQEYSLSSDPPKPASGRTQGSGGKDGHISLTKSYCLTCALASNVGVCWECTSVNVGWFRPDGHSVEVEGQAEVVTKSIVLLRLTLLRCPAFIFTSLTGIYARLLRFFFMWR